MNNIEKPRSEQEIADYINNAYVHVKPVEIIGGGTRSGLGHQVIARSKVSLENHAGIKLYEPEALTLVAKAGTPLKQLQETLMENGQRLPFEPMSHQAIFGTTGNSTIGGVVACNISGPRRIQAGACRDSLIGVRFVNGKGEIIKNGGRVMKNVTGLDLVKLMCGSHGTLGVITEVAFKVLPIAEREATLSISGLSVEKAIWVLSRALSTPFDITGAAHLPDYNGNSLTIMRVEGFSNQVDYRLSGLRKVIAANFDSEIIEGQEHANLWRLVRDVEPFKENTYPVWRVSTMPSQAPIIYNAIRETFDAKFVFDWAGGLIWIRVDDICTARASEIRNVISSCGGHATLVRAGDELRRKTPAFHPQIKRIADLSRSIRNKFDPAGILNPGRLNGVQL